ncbi:MAG: PAS domain S-box protein [Desulfatibacillaceae bacterium]|nr:PAS domain S-box protein [Desulfatibacillaceae bacterium]
MSQKNQRVMTKKNADNKQTPIVKHKARKAGAAGRQTQGQTSASSPADSHNSGRGPCIKFPGHALAGNAEMEIATGRILSVSKEVSQLSGFSEKELFSMSALEVMGRLNPQMKPVLEKRLSAMAAGEDVPPRVQYSLKDSLGQERWIEVHSTPVRDGSGAPAKVKAVFMDITEQKNIEEKLLASQKELEAKTAELDQMNLALKKLLDQSREDARRFEQRVVANVEDLVLPYLERLHKTKLSADQQVFVNVALANLKELKAPLMRELSLRFPGLTPREIEVANLVRMGSSSRQIAHLLSITRRAVEFHRDSLRNKLGIKKSRRNLRAFLAAL